MTRNRILSLLVCAALLAGLLAGCTSTSGGSQKSTFTFISTFTNPFVRNETVLSERERNKHHGYFKMVQNSDTVIQ